MNYLRHAVFAILFIAASANGSVLSSSSIKSELTTLASGHTDPIIAERLSARMLYKPTAPKTIFRIWSNYNEQSLFKEKWGEVGLNLLRWMEPDSKYKWSSARKFSNPDILIYQQDSLIDLERPLYFINQDQHLSVTGRGYMVADGLALLSERKPLTSERLLSNGSAPIGPDNRIVRICSLGRSSAAPYLELSETQIMRFREKTGLDFSRCLSGDRLAAYWRIRYEDFVDAYKNRTPAHKPGGSW